jgi:hypothetical protein
VKRPLEAYKNILSDRIYGNDKRIFPVIGD